MPAESEPYEGAVRDLFEADAMIPFHLKVADFPNRLEADGDDPAASLPVAFNGKIESEGETDWFRFKAKAGERFHVRTYAATMGSPLDPHIVIKPAEGTESSVEIEADDSQWIDHDWAPHGRWRCKDLADPAAVFEADVDGDYLLGVSDNQRLFSPLHIYRVEFQPAHDRVWLQNTHDYRESFEKRDTIVVPLAPASSEPITWSCHRSPSSRANTTSLSAACLRA